MVSKGPRRGIGVSGLMALVAALAFFFWSLNAMLHPDLLIATTIEVDPGGYPRPGTLDGALSDAVLNQAIGILAVKRPGLTAKSVRNRLGPMTREMPGGCYRYFLCYAVQSAEEAGDAELLGAVARAFVESRPKGEARIVFPVRTHRFPRGGDLGWVIGTGLLVFWLLIVLTVNALLPRKQVANAVTPGGSRIVSG